MFELKEIMCAFKCICENTSNVNNNAQSKDKDEPPINVWKKERKKWNDGNLVYCVTSVRLTLTHTYSLLWHVFFFVFVPFFSVAKIDYIFFFIRFNYLLISMKVSSHKKNDHSYFSHIIHTIKLFLCSFCSYLLF